MNANVLRHYLNKLRNVAKVYREKRDMPDADWRKVCSVNNVPFGRISLEPDGALVLHLEHSLIRLPKTPAAFRVLPGYSLLFELDAYTGCQVVWDEQRDMLSINWDRATYFVDSFEELYTLWEIYCSGDYDFTPASSTVVMDVGANVGFTSIFLADVNPDLEVVAFEPVPENFAKATRNLKGNSHLTERITFHNVGLFSEDGQKTISSVEGNRVRSSLVVDLAKKVKGELDSIPIEVRRASNIVREVAERYPGRRIVIKMDCEGSEYHILRNLEAEGALGLISGFLMEWHKLDHKEDNATFIRTFLKRTGFDVCMLGRLQSKNEVGMAYAFRVTANPR